MTDDRFYRLEIANKSFDDVGYMIYKTKVLRRIYPHAVKHVQRIINLNLPEIIDTRFVEPDVVEHPYIPFISFISEWPPEMVRDAALLYLGMMKKLHAAGLSSKDGHSLNVQWVGKRPYFIDIGSIAVNPDKIWWFTEFKQFYVTRLREFTDVPDMTMNLNHMIETMQKLKFKVPDKGWAAYSQTGLDRKELISKLPGMTMIDFGCNRGHYSKQAAALGKKVLAIDHEPQACDALYSSITNEDVTVLCFDLKKRHGDGHFGQYYASRSHLVRPSHTRLKCDSGIAFALTHHLCRAGWSFNEIVERLSAYVRWSLIIEFIPKEDQHIKGWNLPDNYHLDAFIVAFKPYWKTIRTIKSHPEPRVLVMLGDKIQL